MGVIIPGRIFPCCWSHDNPHHCPHSCWKAGMRLWSRLIPAIGFWAADWKFDCCPAWCSYCNHRLSLNPSSKLRHCLLCSPQVFPPWKTTIGPPLTAIFIEPAWVLFLNNAIGQSPDAAPDHPYNWMNSENRYCSAGNPIPVGTYITLPSILLLWLEEMQAMPMEPAYHPLLPAVFMMLLPVYPDESRPSGCNCQRDYQHLPVYLFNVGLVGRSALPW